MNLLKKLLGIKLDVCDCQNACCETDNESSEHHCCGNHN